MWLWGGVASRPTANTLLSQSPLPPPRSSELPLHAKAKEVLNRLEADALLGTEIETDKMEYLADALVADELEARRGSIRVQVALVAWVVAPHPICIKRAAEHDRDAQVQL